MSPDGATDKWRPTLQHSTARWIRFLSFFFFYIGLARQSVQSLRSFYSRYRRSKRLMQRVGLKYFTAICKSHREGPTGGDLARKIHANRIYVDPLFRKCSRRRRLNSSRAIFTPPGALERYFEYRSLRFSRLAFASGRRLLARN